MWAGPHMGAVMSLEGLRGVKGSGHVASGSQSARGGVAVVVPPAGVVAAGKFPTSWVTWEPGVQSATREVRGGAVVRGKRRHVGS